MKRTAITITVIAVVILAALAAYKRARDIGYADAKSGKTRGGAWNYPPLSTAYRAGAAQASQEAAAAQAAKSA